MREQLLELLAEPNTACPLTLDATKWDGENIEEGWLKSSQSGRSYPIRRGIPRFVNDEGYTDNFGLQWNRFREAQLDSSSGHSRSEQRFDSETRFTADEIRGKWILDGGCGAGRFAEVAASKGARVVAMDYSTAIDATQQTVKGFDNVDLVQGNLLELPFKRDVFDFAYSIGVVQHTPDPAVVIRNLVSAVKPGGRFALTIYGRRPWTKLNAKYLIRPITRRLPASTLLGLVQKAMPFVFPVTDRLFPLPYIGKVARFVIPVAGYEHGTREQRYEEAVLDTFDMLSPRFDSPMTWKEVASVLDDARVTDYTFIDKIPVVVVGSR